MWKVFGEVCRFRYIAKFIYQKFIYPKRQPKHHKRHKRHFLVMCFAWELTYITGHLINNVFKLRTRFHDLAKSFVSIHLQEEKTFSLASVYSKRYKSQNGCLECASCFDCLVKSPRMLIEIQQYTVTKDERVIYNLNFLFVFFLQNMIRGSFG